MCPRCKTSHPVVVSNVGVTVCVCVCVWRKEQTQCRLKRQCLLGKNIIICQYKMRRTLLLHYLVAGLEEEKSLGLQQEGKLARLSFTSKYSTSHIIEDV